MAFIGYALSAEEHAPNDLVHYARKAEDIGFDFLMISDHYHPWIDRQGHSPFVWNVIGGIAHATRRIPLGTGVTCPTVRIHPAVLAQAAATTAAMMPGRFFFGVGSGENLNEHILGDHWPPASVRLEMLEEAISVIRQLWEGQETSFWGDYFTVENAKIYTLPDELPHIYVAAGGSTAAELAGKVGDGLISTAPDEDLIDIFERSGGKGKPTYGQVTVCYHEDEAEARKIAFEWWPQTVLPGALKADLPTPDHFEQAVKLVTEDKVAEKIPCGPDKERHLQEFRKMFEAGFDHVYVHQVGPDQEGFFRFYEQEILPELME
jgi:coenzyme F420-dependent glucose-6-phosphate dehydrogenase